MTLQLQQPKLCLYCNDSLNMAGDRGNGADRTCCHREHSHKFYIFKRRIENLIEQFNLIENKFEEEGELTESTFRFIKGAQEWMKFGLRVDQLNIHFQSILKNKSMTLLPVILLKIKEKKSK